MPAVAVTDLVMAYGGVRAVDSLSFSAATGEVLALIGPNGAGKTSTVEACLGLRPISGGRIELLGHGGPPSTRLRSRLGVMLQEGGFYPSARPLELVTHVARLYPQSDSPADLLSSLGVDPSTRTTIRHLSGGEQQRVKCALALVGRPELVFLDEPTAGLDSTGRRTFHELIRQLTNRGTTVVLTTHLMDDVERLADQVVLMASGTNLYHGSVAELVGNADTIWIRIPIGEAVDTLRTNLPDTATMREHHRGMHRIDGPAPELLGVVATWCGQNGVPTTDVIVGRLSLDDVVHELIENRS